MSIRNILSIILVFSLVMLMLLFVSCTSNTEKDNSNNNADTDINTDDDNNTDGSGLDDSDDNTENPGPDDGDNDNNENTGGGEPCVEHDFSDWRTTEEASCTDDGKQTRSCTVCGSSEIQIIPAPGHKAVTDKAVSATCSETGLTEGSHCSVCKTVIVAQNTVAKTAHTYSAWKTTTSATCKSSGLKERSCNSCGDTQTQTIPATGKHSYSSWQTVSAATCKLSGLKERSCNSCGDTQTQTIPATGVHTYVSGKCKYCGIYEVDISDCQIIKQSRTSTALSAVYSKLTSAISDKVGVNLLIWTDKKNGVSDDKEILIGNTDREETAEALGLLSSEYETEAFIIALIGNKIVIVGYSDDDTALGVHYFINNFVNTVTQKNGKLAFESDKYVCICKTGEINSYYNDYNNALAVERLETVYEEENPLATTDFTYGKIIKLEHQSDSNKNGILIATNENVNGAPWDIYISYDDGKTWQVSSPVVDTVNTGMASGYQPYLFELPVDIGSYKKGTILFSGCSYSSTATKLPLFISTDQGKTWEGLHNIAVGGVYNQGGWSSEGVWEPCLVYDDATKRLYCFYSDEQVNGVTGNHIGGYNQRLVYKYTSDLKTWSKEYNAVAIEGGVRPGMAMVTKMGNGQWALVYEYVGAPEGGTPIYIKFTDNITDWNPSDPGKLILSNSGAHCGSSPAIAWTPAGGECGTLIVTANGQVPPSPTGKCDLFISHDYGKTFVTVKNPIPVKYNPEVRCAYSPGFYVDKEGSVYYINNPEAIQGGICCKLVFAKLNFF